MDNTFVKLYRGLLDWEWYTNINTCRLFIHMLLKANWKDGKFQGNNIERGSFVSSIKKLSEETALTEREVRTAITHLKTTNEVTSKSTSKYTVFTVVNYHIYQSGDIQATNERQASDKPTTGKRQTNDKRTTTIEEVKKERSKEVKNKFIAPTLENVREYCQQMGYGLDAEAYMDFYESKGWMVGKNKMKDWMASVRNWERSDKKSKDSKTNGFNNFEQRDYDFKELEQQWLAKRD